MPLNGDHIFLLPLDGAFDIFCSVSRDHWQPTCWSGVCGEHFIEGSPDGDPNSPDYVPTLKMGENENTKATVESARKTRITYYVADREKLKL